MLNFSAIIATMLGILFLVAYIVPIAMSKPAVNPLRFVRATLFFIAACSIKFNIISGAEILNAVLIFIFSGVEFLSSVIGDEDINSKFETIVINGLSIFVGIATIIFR